MESPADDGGLSRSSGGENKSCGKSCTGYLYHSSVLNSKSRNPRCVGISRTLHQVPDYIVKEAEVQKYESGQKMAEFRYSCIGYSVHMRKAGQLTKKEELPFCVGLEILMMRKAEESGADSVLVHSHRKEDDLSSSQPRPYKPAPAPAPAPASPAREVFINRFAKSSTLVASGVVKNANNVCNQIKSAIENILYPYRRPPK